MTTTEIILFIVLLIFLIFMSAFFSGAETAYTSISKAKLSYKLKGKKKTAKIVRKHLKGFGWTLATILIGNNIVNVSAGVLTPLLLGQLFDIKEQQLTITLVSIIIVTPTIIIFGEVIPKVLAKKYSYGYIKKVAWVIHVFNYLFILLSFPLKFFNIASKITNTEKELHEIIRTGYHEGVLEKNETLLVQNALEFDSTIVRSHYIRAKRIIFVTTEMSIAEIKKVFKTSKLSRLPVKQKRTFIGIVTLKDMFDAPEDYSVKNFILKIPYISQNIILSNALDKLRVNRTNMAFITPNQNSQVVLGIITIEDILEELVGALYDEHDKKGKIIEGGLDKLIIQGDTMIEKVNEFFSNHDEFEKIKIKKDKELNIEDWLKKQSGKNIRLNLTWKYKDLLKFKIIENKRGKSPHIEVSVS